MVKLPAGRRRSRNAAWIMALLGKDKSRLIAACGLAGPCRLGRNGIGHQRRPGHNRAGEQRPQHQENDPAKFHDRYSCSQRAASDAPAEAIPIQAGKVKQNPPIKKPAPVAARVGEGERGLTSRGRPVSPGRSMPLAARTGGGKSALPGGFGFVPVAKGKVPRVLTGGGVRGIASADMAPESLRHLPELLCSSPNALTVPSTIGFGEKITAKCVPQTQ